MLPIESELVSCRGRSSTVEGNLDDLQVHRMDISKGGVWSEAVSTSSRSRELASEMANVWNRESESSTGRLDIFTLHHHFGTESDRVTAISLTPLCRNFPRTFSILVRQRNSPETS